MKYFFLLMIITILNGCASKSIWSSNSPESTKVSFKQGVIELTPAHSIDNYSSTKDILVTNIKVSNTSDKVLSFNPDHIIGLSNSGETVTVMSDQELKAHTDRIGSMTTAMAGNMYMNPSSTQSSLFVEVKSTMATAKPIPPKGHIEGQVWFLIPKAGANEIQFKFYNELQSNDVVAVKREEQGKKRMPASQKNNN